MGFATDIVQNSKKYMVLTDAEGLWAFIARTVTRGWDIPRRRAASQLWDSGAGMHAGNLQRRPVLPLGGVPVRLPPANYGRASAQGRMSSKGRMPVIQGRGRAVHRLGGDTG